MVTEASEAQDIWSLNPKSLPPWSGYLCPHTLLLS